MLCGYWCNTMKFRQYDQAQTKFVNLNYRAILGEESDAVIINDIIERLDISKYEECYVEIGNPAYHPKEMLKIIIYGYYMGYFGGRPLYNNYETDLGLRYLSNDDFPDHRTLNVFRAKFKDMIADIFAQVVMICKELDMIGFENLCVDSQKIKANANVFQNKNLKGVQKEKEKIEGQLKQLLEEEIEFQNGRDTTEIIKKKERLERRRKKLENAAQVLKDAGGEHDDKIRTNLTDPDSKVMTDKRGTKNPDYNCHNAVDDKFQVITAVEVTNDTSDVGELIPMKEASKENTGEPHKNTLADCGYTDKDTYNKMDKDQDTEYYVPDRTKFSSKKNNYDKWHFTYDQERDIFRCPQGNDVVFIRTSKDNKGLTFLLYQGVDCGTCPVRDLCLNLGKGKDNETTKGNRSIRIYPEDELIKEMRKKLDSEDGKNIYKKRGSTVELVHGDIQKNRGFTQFVTKGLEKVQVEYNLIAIAYNIRKIIIHKAGIVRQILADALPT